MKKGIIAMQGSLVASQPGGSIHLLFCVVAIRNSRLCVSAVRLLLIVALGACSCFATAGYCAETVKPDLQKLFHLVGIPGLRRDERVDLTLHSDGLFFATEKVHYEVPYSRIRHVLLMSSDRRYEGRTYAAAVATYGVGALLILKKHHVDTVVLDYVNERGGKMGVVLQMETSQGEVLKGLLKSHELAVEEPDGVSESLPKEQTETTTKDRSKP